MTAAETGALFVLYRFYAADGALLYVGVTNDPPRRFSEHVPKGWWREVASITLQHCDGYGNLLAREIAAIRDERPRYNHTGRTTAIDDSPALDLATAGSALASARDELTKAWAEAQAAAVAAVADGMTEVQVAATLEVERMTVRKWQGKR